MNEIRIWLDDEADDEGKTYRKTPEGYTPIRTPDEFRATVMRCIEQGVRIAAIDFDNDLGVKGAENEGNGLLKWMLREYPEIFLDDIELRVHSLNVEEERKMREEVDRLMSDKEYVRELIEAKSRPDPWASLPMH